jgi:transposase
MTEPFFFAAPPSEAVPINERYSISAVGALRIVFAGGLPIIEYHQDDVAARDLALVQLNQHGGVTEEELSQGFGVSRATVSRAKRAYRAGGVPALVPRKRGRKGPVKIKDEVEAALRMLVKQGAKQADIARRLGLSEAAVHNTLKRLGLRRPGAKQSVFKSREATEPKADAEATLDQESSLARDEVNSELVEWVATAPDTAEPSEPVSTEDAPALQEHDVERQCEVSGVADANEPREEPSGSEECELPAEVTIDRDPTCRALDRFFARMGMLEDAAPLFDTQQKVRWAGLLLAVPLLVKQGFVADVVKSFGGIGPAFYGTRNTVMALLFMLLARITRPEHLKEHSAQELGAVLGLDRFPEMKTLRRKIRLLRAKGCSLELMQRLGKRQLARLKVSHLWLYLDGHVSVYSGKRKLNKHHVTRLRISLPAVLDYWVNDVDGAPLFVVTGAPRKSMVTVITQQVDRLRAQGEQRPITLVFDREGWSPALFAKLAAMPDVYFLSYRKAVQNNPLPELPAASFRPYEGEFDGDKVAYDLSDNGIYLTYGAGRKKKRLHLRQVSRLADNGHQTHIVTNDWQHETIELAYRMFRRWGQENFFKYGSNELGLDALWTYLMEDADGDRLVQNPERKKAKAECRNLKKELERLRADFGDRALSNPEAKRPTMRGFKIANGSLSEQIRHKEVQLAELELRQQQIPAKVPIRQVLQGEQPKQVSIETRRLLHCFRIATYHAESSLRELLRPHYSRWRQDGRTIIQSMLNSTGDIEVNTDELHVALTPQSAPHRTRALQALCDELNQQSVRFPGSNLRLRYSVRDAATVS